MTWLSEYRQDVQRYAALFNRTNWGRMLVLVLTEQGLWALLQYRISSAIYRSSLPWYIRKPLFLLTLIWQKIIEVVTGRKCNIAQGVTIGISGRGERKGAPTIGDRVFIGPNAVVVGKIVVGD